MDLPYWGTFGSAAGMDIFESATRVLDLEDVAAARTLCSIFRELFHAMGLTRGSMFDPVVLFVKEEIEKGNMIYIIFTGKYDFILW